MTSENIVRAVVQARMSSRRFPGKVLAPFRGEPLILHVLRAIQRVPGIDSLVVATSTDRCDDPLVAFLTSLGIGVFRGPCGNVFERYRLYALQSPCEFILRISADSPLLDPEVIDRVVNHPERDAADLVTTVCPRTFPKGQNAEMFRTGRMLIIDPADMTSYEREHVIPFFYGHSDGYRIVNVESGDSELATANLTIDTVEDLRRMEQLSDEELARLRNRVRPWILS